MKAILTVGISASGKTTWAEQYIKDNQGWVNINRDDLRFELYTNGERNWSKYHFKKSREQKITDMVNRKIVDRALKSDNIIISDTNLNETFRSNLIKMLEDLGYQIELKYFPIDFKEALSRDKLRSNSVGYEIILLQYIKYQRQIGGVQVYQQLVGKPTYIFDIDGTLACKGDRSPFDMTNVLEDTPIKSVCNIAEALNYNGAEIIFLSGRDSSCALDTREWLKTFVGDWTQDCFLFMREEGDRRKDYVVKMELFDKYIRNRCNVIGVFDDRKQVIEQCWSVIGVPIFDVGNKWERF
jgi:predicted kinase